jgi:2-(1,2-epoxy-1,2-dihydrophenyl)acetyl-CoA isomerase
MPDVTETIQDGIATLTLNRPDSLNALSSDMQDCLREADIKSMGQRNQMPFEHRIEALRKMHLIPQMMRTCPKVIIGMINGPAFGAGLGMAMSCDLRIAARSARFGVAFGNIGYSGDFGGSWLLTQLVGTSKARELYLLGERFDAAEAERIGLVNRVVDDSALLEETTAMARKLADGPLVAFGYMKRNLHAAETEPLAAVLEMEAVHQARTAQTDDHREARTAFLEKRRPVFKGQ